MSFMTRLSLHKHINFEGINYGEQENGNMKIRAFKRFSPILNKV